ncbi:DNA/RNA helicase domain-containing protein [Gottfriedia acidiceleris]|uniref:DNA/RNA helicase domain-containing protein n=1 Tax=Gottfriedia acidiceleris TaxID=371036 RepID=UPI003AF58B7F
MANWIDNFVEKKIIEILNDPKYDFIVFESSTKMYEEIQVMNNRFGLARIVSTFDYIHKKRQSKVLRLRG